MDKRTEFQPTFLRIGIDTFDEQCEKTKGFVAGVGVKGVHYYDDTASLLLLIDHLLDTIGKPQASTISRKFQGETAIAGAPYKWNPEIYHTTEEIKQLQGKLWTVDVNMLSRYHSSWQGLVYNIEGECVGKFDSELQLLKMLSDKNLLAANR